MKLMKYSPEMRWPLYATRRYVYDNLCYSKGRDPWEVILITLEDLFTPYIELVTKTLWKARKAL